LFGHDRGAFTGAITQTTGRFQTADRGTLFLDEIGDLPLELQPKLLRVLQERQFERLGSNHSIQVDVRAATNQNLWHMVQQGKFRADLYYRLNVFPIELPPLRERRADIPELVGHFVGKLASRQGKSIREIPERVIEALKRHPWPGNIRELQNFVERALIMTTGSVLRAPIAELGREAAGPLRGRTLAEAERAHSRTLGNRLGRWWMEWRCRETRVASHNAYCKNEAARNPARNSAIEGRRPVVASCGGEWRTVANIR
jgi:formate hydrogenlyase transcriptional activator